MIVGQNQTDRQWGVGLLIAWLLAIMATAGPTWRPEPSPFADDPVPVMLVLRAGETMELSDDTSANFSDMNWLAGLFNTNDSTALT